MKSAKRVGLLGFYSNRAEAEEALDFLRLSGYKTEEVWAILPEGKSEGGILNWLSRVQTVDFQGLGKLIVGGALSPVPLKGALRDSLARLGANAGEAESCENYLRAGGGMVAVQCGNSDWLSRANDVFRRSGATGVSRLGGTARAVSANGA